MPSYRYRAVHGSGRVLQGVAAAANERELAQFLNQSHLELISAKPKKTSATAHLSLNISRQHVPLRTLAMFCAHAADLLKAGMVLLDVLKELADMMETGALRDALHDVTRALSHGSRIAEAFARHPRIFTKTFIAILGAGETGGDITHAFEQLSICTEARARMNERIIRAVRYPLFLLAVAGGVACFMMLMVVPQIVSFLQSIDSQLPLSTRILIGLSDIFAAVWWIIGLAIIGVATLAMLLHRHVPVAAHFLDACLLRLPLIGDVMKKLMLARFAQSFAILVQSGLNIPESLQGARDTLGNRALESRLDEAAARITTGCAVSEAMTEFFPPFAQRILRIGEQGGRLPKSLSDIATHYEREAADSVDRMIGALEPCLTLTIGSLLAWVVLAVLGPIYGSLTTINTLR